MNSSDVGMILVQLGSRKVKNRSNGGLTASCPLAPYSGTHKGRDDNPSLIVWQDGGSWACKCYACKFKGSIMDMVDAYGDVSGVSVSDIKKVIRTDGKTDVISRIKSVSRRFDDVPDTARVCPVKGSISKDWWSSSGYLESYKDDVVIKEEDISEWVGKYPRYIAKRGISIELAKEWGLGLARPLEIEYKNHDGSVFKKNYGSRLMFFLRNHEGKLVGWSGRAIFDESKPKYIHSKGTRMSWYLYGENKIDLSVRRGYVVEGFMDVLRLSSLGYNNSLAVMSGSISKHQLDKLCGWFDEIVIVPDGDDAGLMLTLGVRSKIPDTVKLKVAGHVSGMDPGDFEAETATRVIENSTMNEGVSWELNSGKWKAFIADINNRLVTLGSFETEDEAVRSYNEAYRHLNNG